MTDRTVIWIAIDKALQALQYPTLAELTLTQAGEQELKTSLWAEAVQTMVDACVRMQKRETEVEESRTVTGEGN